MRKSIYVLVLFSLLFGQFPMAQTKENQKPTVPKFTDVNSEVLQMFIQDQWDRGNDVFGGGKVKAPQNLDWKEITKRDVQRQNRIRSLMAEGKLQNARDYQYAGLIFQHSDDSQCLLLAHVLAVSAAAKGEINARWLAAATLDRYLQSIQRPQVFGTQFLQSDEKNWTMEPYERGLLSDSMRAMWCVVPVSEQSQILKEGAEGKGLRSTTARDCK